MVGSLPGVLRQPPAPTPAGFRLSSEDFYLGWPRFRVPYAEEIGLLLFFVAAFRLSSLEGG